jgi:hypothetical protein
VSRAIPKFQSGTPITAVAATTTQTSSTIQNADGRRLHVVLNVTSAGTGSVTVTINGVSNSGVVYPLLVGTAVTANGTTVYRVGPALTPSANAVANDMIPHLFQIVVTANNANAMTYTVDYCLGV